MATVEYLDSANDDGMSIGRSSTSKASVYGATPVTQAAAITTITASTAADSNAVVAVNSILTVLRNYGLIAS